MPDMVHVGMPVMLSNNYSPRMVVSALNWDTMRATVVWFEEIEGKWTLRSTNLPMAGLVPITLMEYTEEVERV